MITDAQFRADFPEFNDSSRYPPSVVAFQINFAAVQMNQCRWGASTYNEPPAVPPAPITATTLSLYDMGMELFVAHNLALEAQAARQGAAGGVPGASTGGTSSKSVDKVSVGYDTAVASLEGGGDFNLTVYGTRYLRLLRMVGTGGIML
jgi:hypothetical protein